MTGTPIFDELYAKYVAGAAARGTAAAHAATVPAPSEPRHEQYAGSVEAPKWPN